MVLTLLVKSLSVFKHLMARFKTAEVHIFSQSILKSRNVALNLMTANTRSTR